MNVEHLPVAVLGAGPIGLAAAAHLVERGIPFILFEKGDGAGHNIKKWGHVRLFSPWSECQDSAAVRLLEAENWVAPDPGSVPFGRDLVDHYLEPLSRILAIAASLRLNTTVESISRKNMDKVGSRKREDTPFIIRTQSAVAGQEEYLARSVIDTTGTWGSPNPMGSSGIPALGESEMQEHVVYGIPDASGADVERYASKKTLVIGSGHSATNTLLDLALLRTRHPETEIHWAIRAATPGRYFGGEEDDALAGRGALGRRLHELVDSGQMTIHTTFRSQSITQDGERLNVVGEYEGQNIQVDELVVSTGSRPDFSFLREIRLSVDSALECSSELAPLIDPNVHSCGSVRPHGERELRHEEPGFYIAGMKSYGRAPTFLLLTGHEQVRSIVASLAGDQQSADRVELELPETGVCSSTLFVTDSMSPERLKLELAEESQSSGTSCYGPSVSCCD